MEHKYINEAGLIDRYLTRKLSAEESAAFEEHFVDCQQCVGDLNATKALMEGLRVVAADGSAQRTGTERRDLFWWLKPTRSRWSLLLASAALIAFAAAALVSIQLRGSRLEADQARSAAAEWQRRFEDERESASLEQKRNQDSEQSLKAQIAQLQEHKAETGTEPGAFKEPQINLAIFFLKSTRGAGSSGTINEVKIPSTPANFVLSVSVEGEGPYAGYRGALLNGQGAIIWESRRLKPDARNLIWLGFNSSSLRNGNYTLTVDGVSSDRTTHAVGSYSIRVLKVTEH
jgi:hypothetical protein